MTGVPIFWLAGNRIASRLDAARALATGFAVIGIWVILEVGIFAVSDISQIELTLTWMWLANFATKAAALLGSIRRAAIRSS